MMRDYRTWCWSCAVPLLLATAGCSDAPSGPSKPSVRPWPAAKAAMAAYDLDGNGRIDGQELEKSPPLKSLLASIKAADPGHPDALTEADIVQRIQKWLGSGTALMGGSVQVTLGGNPLAGATVSMEPEPFLGPSYRIATGITDDHGAATLSGSLAEFPGVYVGLYRVKISKKDHEQEVVPAKYNEKTVLGREVADDIPTLREMFRFELEAR